MTSPIQRFFSAALEAAKKIEQKKGTAEQMRAALLRHGAKPSELKYTGVDDFMTHWAGRKERLGPAADDKLTRDQIVDYIDANQVKAEEVLKKGVGGTSDEASNDVGAVADAMIRAQSADADEAAEAKALFRQMVGYDFHPDMFQLTRMTPESIAAYSSGVTQRAPIPPAALSAWDAEIDAALNRVWDSELSDRIGAHRTGETKWSEYSSQPASEDYAEHLVTLPLRPGGITSDLDSDYGPNNYQSPHWEEPNVLAHMRYDIDPDALRVEEYQSDWLQQAREKGFRPTDSEVLKRYNDLSAEAYHMQRDRNDVYRQLRDLRASRPMTIEQLMKANELEETVARMPDPEKWEEFTKLRSQVHSGVPRAPLANVNDWTSMLIRRSLLEAALQDKPKVRWTPGVLQDARYSEQAGRRKYYDEIVPNLYSKILKPWGGKVKKPYEYDDNPRGIPATESNRAEDEYWNADIPSELMRKLQERGAVPFFKRGGRV